MKKITISILLILLFSLPAFGLDFSVAYTKQVPASENLGDFDGVKVSVSPNDAIFYLWTSGEHGRLTLGSQQFTYIDLVGAGVGIKKIFDGFQIFADAGWFEPYSAYNDKIFAHGEDGFDRLWLHLNQAYAPSLGVHDFDYYKMHISGNFGGSFGIKYFYQLSKNMEIYGLAGYRILSLPMIVEAWWDGNPNGWNRFENESLTGPFVGLGFSF